MGSLRTSVLITAQNLLSPHLERINKDLHRLDARLEKSNKSFKNLAPQIRNVGLGMTAVGTAAAYTIKKFSDVSNEAEGVGRAFNNFFGDQAPASLERLQKATQNTVSELDIMKQANQAMLLGIDKEALPTMFEGALAAAQATGRPVADAITDITTGIGRQSKLILDNLGIVVNTEQAYETYARSIGKSTSALSDNEKKIAFTNAVMKALNENAKRIGPITESNSIKMQQASAKMADAVKKLGDAFAPTIANIADKLGALVEKFNNLDPKTRDAIAKIALLTTGFLLIAGPILSFIGSIGAAAKTLTALSGAAKIAATAIGAANPIFWALAAAVAATTAVIVIQKKRYEELGRQYQATNDAIQSSFDDQMSKMKTYLSVAEKTASRDAQLARLRAKAYADMAAVTASVGRLNAAVQREASEDIINSLESEVEALNLRAGDSARAAMEFARNNTDAAERVSKAYEDMSQSVTDSSEDFGGAIGGAADEAEKKAEELEAAIEDLKQEYRDSMQDINEKIFELEYNHKEKMQSIRDEMKRVEDSVKELEDQYNDSVDNMRKGIAERIVEEQEKINELIEKRKDLEGRRAGEDDPERQSKLQIDENALIADIQKREEALERVKEKELVTQDEINEAKRRASLTDLERFIEDQEAKSEVLDADFLKRQEQLDAEMSKLEEQAERETTLFNIKRQDYELTKQSMQQFHDSYISNLNEMETVTKAQVTSMRNQLVQLRQIISEIQSLMRSQSAASSAARNNRVSGGNTFVPQFARGGRVDSNSIVEVAEGDRPEAIVPLPDGRRIPVDLGGNAGGNTNNVNVTVNVGDGSNVDESQLSDTIKKVVVDAIRNQKFKAYSV